MAAVQNQVSNPASLTHFLRKQAPALNRDSRGTGALTCGALPTQPVLRPAARICSHRLHGDGMRCHVNVIAITLQTSKGTFREAQACAKSPADLNPYLSARLPMYSHSVSQSECPAVLHRGQRRDQPKTTGARGAARRRCACAAGWPRHPRSQLSGTFLTSLNREAPEAS